MILLLSMLIVTPCTADIPTIIDSHFYDRFGYDNCDSHSNGEADVVRSCIPNCGIVFDVGANKGDWTDMVLHAHPQITIFAFEPIPRLQEVLRRRFSSNGVVVMPYAVSSSTGVASFDYYPSHDALSGLIHRPTLGIGAATRLTVETATLDQFCAENNIDEIAFLKIDTEGAEYAVLSGAMHLLKNQKIRAIQFEYGGTYPDAGHTLREVYELLTGHGYSLYRISKGGLIYLQEWRSALEAYRYSNYLAVRFGESPCIT